MKVTLNTTLQNANTNFAVRKAPQLQESALNVQNQIVTPEVEEEDYSDDKFLLGLGIFTALCIGAITTLSGKKQPVNVVKTNLPAVIPPGAEAKFLPKTEAEKMAVCKQIHQLQEVLAYIARQPERACEKSTEQSVQMIEQRIGKLTNRLIYA